MTKNLKNIKKVAIYRDKKHLSFREIAKIFRKDVSTIFRWYKKSKTVAQ